MNAETQHNELPVRRAIRLAGGPTALARQLATTQSRVSNWSVRGRVPAECVLDVEAALDGRVTRYELRPDIYGDREPDAAA